MKNLLLITLISLTSSFGIFAQTIRTVAEQEKSFNVESFSEINMATVGNATLIESKNFRVEIVANIDIDEEINVEVRNNKLKITDNYDNVKNGQNVDVEITIYAPKFDAITLSGVGNIDAEKLSTKELELENTGVGNIDLENVKADYISAILTGVGDIKLDGTSKEINFKLSGVGDIKAYDLIAGKAKVKTTGVGNAKINVSDDLFARANGVGSIYYKGNPTVDGDHAEYTANIKHVN